ncbi:MAG TPA: MBL fold metallo-hydrolase [Xanthobacteraceae bacterium]|jgi:L-ascorbate metabolism protein UlaG (beta-lactamase superfamily)|nr:MBL fold metallo-hydrolase [Xanthobacteraceae bacterium]
MSRLVRFTWALLTAVSLAFALLVVPRAGAQPPSAQAPSVQAPSAQAPQPKQEAKPEMVENCPGLIASGRPRVMPASLQLALNPDEVRISYAGHSTFLIESPQQVRIATDYNDYVRPRVLPDIATMNHAHDSHFTDTPAPGIRHVLRGWGPSPNQPARHDVQLRDVRVRNVPTNIRNWNGGTELHGNSIFIYEMANMCIAHLGHLHHTLNQQQLNEIGRIDVLFVPVDANLTLDMAGMIEVLQAMKAPLMIPMHYFSVYTLHRFLDQVRPLNWTVEMNPLPTTVVSKTTLPTTPKVLVLPGR